MRRTRKQLEELQLAMRERWKAGPVQSRPGRPVRRLDRDFAFILAVHGVTYTEIATLLGCDRKTLTRHCGEVLRRAARWRTEMVPRFLWQRRANRVAQIVARSRASSEWSYEEQGTALRGLGLDFGKKIACQD